MKKNSDWREKYQAPEILAVDISAEGVLCESYENEEYGQVTNYGDSESDSYWKGWY